MRATMAAAPTDLMGHSESETDRLIRQGQFLDPATRRLLTEAGIATGMRDLDPGSGAGDVALTAMELVGPTGRVIGVDRNADRLAGDDR